MFNSINISAHAFHHTVLKYSLIVQSPIIRLVEMTAVSVDLLKHDRYSSEVIEM